MNSIESNSGGHRFRQELINKALIYQGFVYFYLYWYAIWRWFVVNGSVRSSTISEVRQEMLRENWLEEMLLNEESAAATIPELQMPTQEELVIREMVLLGEISEEEALAMLNQSRAN